MTDNPEGLTKVQRERLAKLCKAPWSWFCSDARYYRIQDGMVAANQRAYWATLNRVTGYHGPDYRVQLPGQSSFIRASPLQYEQAGSVGVPRSIGVPS